MRKQEQEKTYQEIMKYYEYANILIDTVKDSSHTLADEEFDIIESVINAMEVNADKITSQYIQYIKIGDKEKSSDLMRNAFNEIIAKIEECRNKILILHKL